jgi:hypothetical protein
MSQCISIQHCAAAGRLHPCQHLQWTVAVQQSTSGCGLHQILKKFMAQHYNHLIAGMLLQHVIFRSENSSGLWPHRHGPDSAEAAKSFSMERHLVDFSISRCQRCGPTSAPAARSFSVERHLSFSRFHGVKDAIPTLQELQGHSQWKDTCQFLDFMVSKMRSQLCNTCKAVGR